MNFTLIAAVAGFFVGPLALTYLPSQRRRRRQEATGLAEYRMPGGDL